MRKKAIQSFRLRLHSGLRQSGRACGPAFYGTVETVPFRFLRAEEQLERATVFPHLKIDMWGIRFLLILRVNAARRSSFYETETYFLCANRACESIARAEKQFNTVRFLFNYEAGDHILMIEVVKLHGHD